jgi:hypothetical protein
MSVPTAPVSPSPDRFEPNNSIVQATMLGRVTQTTLVGLTLDSGSDLDDFRFKSAGAGAYQIDATGTTIKILDARGRLLATAKDHLTFNTPKRVGNYILQISSSDGSPVSDYDLKLSFGRVSKNPMTRHLARRVAWPRIPARPAIHSPRIRPATRIAPHTSLSTVHFLTVLGQTPRQSITSSRPKSLLIGHTS